LSVTLLLETCDGTNGRNDGEQGGCDVAITFAEES
jgi:hypothetical protein